MRKTLAIPMAVIVIAATAMLCLLTPSLSAPATVNPLTTLGDKAMPGTSVVKILPGSPAATNAVRGTEAVAAMATIDTKTASASSSILMYAMAGPTAGQEMMISALMGDEPAENIMVTRIDAQQPTAGLISVSAGKTQILSHLVFG